MTLAACIDSGAARSVIPDGSLCEYPVRQDEESGRQYLAATGQAIGGQGF